MPIAPTTRTAQQIIDRLKRQFGDESGAQVTDPDIIAWINAGQQEINLRNRIIKGTATLPTVIGTRVYTFPAVSIMEIMTLFYNGKPIDPVAYQEAQTYIVKNDPTFTLTGTPVFWYEWGPNLNLYPTPDAVGTLSMDYVGYPTDVTTGADTLAVPDSYFNSLLEYCLKQAYEQDDDWTGSSIKGDALDKSLGNLAEDGQRYQRNTYPIITIVDEECW